MGYRRRVAVAVSYVSPIGGSQREYEAEWAEDAHDSTGKSLGPATRYHAHFTVTLTPPTDEPAIYANPAGLFITDLDWTAKTH